MAMRATTKVIGKLWDSPIDPIFKINKKYLHKGFNPMIGIFFSEFKELLR